MLYIGPGDGEYADAHEGYVAGRYRDGTISDIWTNTSECPDGTFEAYVPACECGWLGRTQPATGEARRNCQQAWLCDHFEHLEPVRTIIDGLERPFGCTRTSS